jgi:hypothetical protein
VVSSDARELIMVAPYCPVDRGTVPEGSTEHKPIVVHQYKVLSQHPYKYTERELSHEVHIVRRGKQEGELQLHKYDLKRSSLLKSTGGELTITRTAGSRSSVAKWKNTSG